MKKIFFIYILFAFMLISCSNSTSSVSNDEDTQIPTGYGILSFSIGNNTSADRTAINLDTILSKVSQYEIVIYNSTKRYEETFTLDETKSLIIEEGTYNSIIVATDGHNKTYEYGGRGSSLGSGYAKNITITSGKKTIPSVKSFFLLGSWLIAILSSKLSSFSSGDFIIYNSI